MAQTGGEGGEEGTAHGGTGKGGGAGGHVIGRGGKRRPTLGKGEDPTIFTEGHLLAVHFPICGIT